MVDSASENDRYITLLLSTKNNDAELVEQIRREYKPAAPGTLNTDTTLPYRQL